MLDTNWRPIGLDVIWTVGDRRLHAMHRAAERMWRVRIEYGGGTREQQGDYPEGCEVEYTTHLFNMVILARRDFQVGGEHDFPVLRIGPPLMAVTPARMLYRCVEVGTHDSPIGRVKAKRYVASLPDLYRHVWRRGPAGTEIPLILARGGTPLHVDVRSADRHDLLKKPSLQ